MSNPAVTKLCLTKIAGLPMWMDDNIGESIHIHYGDFRVDLTYREFSSLCDEISDTINSYLNIDKFDFNNINPLYFEVMLRNNISHLIDIRMDYVYLKDMLCPSNGIYEKLPKSRCVRALYGDTKDNNERRKSHHIGQTSQERLDTVYQSIKDNGYPYRGEYIIMYGQDNIIQDGQHRAASLWSIHGNIEVPVMRLFFDNYISPDIKKIKRNTSVLGYKMRGYISMLRTPKSTTNQMINKFNICGRQFVKSQICKCYTQKHVNDISKYFNIVHNR